MLHVIKFPISLLSVFLLTGCAALAGLFPSSGANSSANANAVAPAAGAATASVPSIMDEVEPSTRLAMFSPAALMDRNASIERTVVDAQCRFRTPDPPFLVPRPNANKLWTFNGRVEQADAKGDGPASDAEALEYRSWFGLGWSKQQLNTWPVALVSLSQMPEQYLEDQLTVLSDHQQQIDKAEQVTLTRGYIQNSQEIEARVQLLIDNFDPGKCPTD